MRGEERSAKYRYFLGTCTQLKENCRLSLPLPPPQGKPQLGFGAVQRRAATALRNRSATQQEPGMGKRWPRSDQVCLWSRADSSALVGNHLLPEESCCAQDKAENKQQKKKGEGIFELFHCLLLLYSCWGFFSPSLAQHLTTERTAWETRVPACEVQPSSPPSLDHTGRYQSGASGNRESEGCPEISLGD